MKKTLIALVAAGTALVATSAFAGASYSVAYSSVTAQLSSSHGSQTATTFGQTYTNSVGNGFAVANGYADAIGQQYTNHGNGYKLASSFITVGSSSTSGHYNSNAGGSGGCGCGHHH